jgi:hypothetical protein
VKCEIQKCEKNENKNNGKKLLQKILFDNSPRHYIGQFLVGSCKNQTLCALANSYMFKKKFDTLIG